MLASSTAPKVHRPPVLKKLQPFPAVAIRLMQIVATDDVVFRRVAELIRSDPAISAEVLRLANSPMLGCRQQIAGVLHALAILGLDRLKSLVIMVSLRNFLSATLKVPTLLRCWRHSLATAILAEQLASSSWLDPDRAYTAGLLHDIGRTALLATYPQEYARIIDLVDDADCDLMECERTRFGVDHCEAGGWLVAEWEFPTEYLAYTTEHHLEPISERFSLLEAVQLSCRLADMLGFQVAGPAPLDSFDKIRMRLPESARAKVPPEEKLLLMVASKINAIECSLGAS